MADLMQLAIGPVQILLRQSVGQRLQHRFDIFALCQAFFCQCKFASLQRFGIFRQCPDHRHMLT